MAEYNPNAAWGSKKKPEREPYFKKTPVEKFDEQPVTKGSRTILWSVIIFTVLVLGGFSYLFFLRPNSGPNVSIEFSKPDQILVGDQFILSASFSNESQNVLKNVTLSVVLPDNVSFAGQSTGQRVMDQAIGDLGPGSINKQEFKLIVTGDPNSIKHIDAKLTYSADSSSKTQFETDGGVDLIVSGPAISLNINAPTNIFSGQDFDITVSYNNNTSHGFKSVKLNMQYPPVFTFTRSSAPASTNGNNTWDLGNIPAAGSGSIIITGNIVGSDKSIYSLAGNLSGEVMGDIYRLSDQSASLAITSSPLALAVSLNSSPDYVAGLGDTLNYAITYTNNSNVTFQSMALKAKLVGDMFDFRTLGSTGAFDSVRNTITWYGANTPQLLNLAPGQSGSVQFQIRTKQSYPIRLLSDKNYTLKLSAQISSPTVPPGTAASSTVSVTSVENKVGGNIVIAAKGFWRDASSGILNSGPYPPKVNQATQYTIHWAVTNYATDMQNLSVSAYLQSGTRCTGTIKSNGSTVPVCNDATGQVTWQISSIPATTGVLGVPMEAIFQVVNTPAVNQVGQTITLLGETTLQAMDVFTGASPQVKASPVTTDLPDDKTVSNVSNHRVVQ